MNYRRLGRTGFQVSVIGMGTCQLRLVPERQAVATLCSAFDLGVNLVHTAPDYEGTDDLIVQALKETPRQVIVCSQGFGPMDRFVQHFEEMCAKLGKNRLELFGITCIEDREAAGDNLWGQGGMADFLLRKKEEGRLGGIFCTTHKSPEYIKKLIETNVFDALMIAYNMLGFHLLSETYPPLGEDPDADTMNMAILRHRQQEGFEDLHRNRTEVFPLARARDIGLMIMKPLAGGLLCSAKAFPERARVTPERPYVRAGEALRFILQNPEVACVVPGMASPAEAEEDARAGWGDLAVAPERAQRLHATVRQLDTALCSRCGQCLSTCSQGLWVPWLFRAGYIAAYPSETFETPDEFEYFRLHPAGAALCSTCPDVTCECPAGIDIPAGLTQIHGALTQLAERGLAPSVAVLETAPVGTADFAAKLVTQDVPESVRLGEPAVCKLYLHNAGEQPWQAPQTTLCVQVDGMLRQTIPLRAAIDPGERGHFTFELPPFNRADVHQLRFELRVACAEHPTPTVLALGEGKLTVEAPPGPNRGKGVRVTKNKWFSFLRRPEASAPAVLAEGPVYAVGYLHHNIPSRMPADTLYTFWLTLENRGTATWQCHPQQGDPAQLAVFLDGEHIHPEPFPTETVTPGQRVTLNWSFRTPQTVGLHTLKLDVLDQGTIFLEQQGVPPLEVAVEVTEAAPTESSRLMDWARVTNCWHIRPSQGQSWSRDGPAYPLFAREARGCRITDLEGRTYLDYVMGFSCALLGYAHPRIQQAVRAALHSAGVISLPPYLEMEVTQMLCEDIPCAEMVIFGKNGSDVCTAAARLARVSTGRHKILACGYHGWQDWFVEPRGFAATGIPDRSDPLVIHFPFNNLEGFLKILHAHQGTVAAVMLEPAGPAEGDDLNGPLQDADPAFLRGLAEAARREGALLIYDEIITGFRYPGGSVQKATGVVPDLACFGKALSAGMPLSVLVGRRDIMQPWMDHIYYGPTFQSEVYSFAAAKEALTIYRELDVAGHIWSFGNRLKEGINALCRQLGAPAELIGPPFRMVLSFKEPDTRRMLLMRTLMQQELVKKGVLTFMGFMLPSLAHDDQALDETLQAFAHALRVLGEVGADDSFADHLEIPPVGW